MYLMWEGAKPTNTETQKWKGMKQFEKVGIRNLAYGSFKPKYRRFRASLLYRKYRKYRRNLTPVNVKF